MSDQLLFEAGHFDPDYLPLFLAPLFMLVFIWLFPGLLTASAKRLPESMIRAPRNKNGEINMKAVKIFLRFATGFIILWFAAGFLGQCHLYRHTVSEYKKGNYLTAEGYVENFEPENTSSHKFECFDIDGVHFEYSSMSLQPGYHKSQHQGDIIEGNGQYLKIAYVYYNSSYGNVILRIEKAYP